MMTHDEMVAVIQAHEQGKQLQMRATIGPFGAEWHDREPVEFNFVAYDYRVKPNEPREWWMRSHGNKNPCTSCGLFDSRATAEKAAADGQYIASIIHVREVID